MKLEAKIGWLYGFIAMILFSFNPITGMMTMMMTVILMFILWCADINVKQRVEYYKKPEQLYKIGKNMHGADKIHEFQLNIIPYTIKGLFLMVKFIATLPMVMSIVIGMLLTIIAVNHIVKYEYYQSFAIFNIIPNKHWFSVGIPLHIIATFFLFLMARSFWKRMDYFKERALGDEKKLENE